MNLTEKIISLEDSVRYFCTVVYTYNIQETEQKDSLYVLLIQNLLNIQGGL